MVTMKDLDLGLKRTSTIPFTIMEKVLIVMGDVDIGIILASIHPKIHVILVDCQVFLFMVIGEVYIGLRPSTFLHTTILDYTFSTQGYLKNLFQGLCKEKIFKTVIKAVSYIHIKIILIILIQ